MAATQASSILLPTSDVKTRKIQNRMENRIHHTKFHLSVLLLKMCTSTPPVKHNSDALCTSHSIAFLSGLQSPGVVLFRVEDTGSLPVTEGGRG